MLPLHPYNEWFPMMSDQELEELAESIKHGGLLVPIVLDQTGQVLDGKCRPPACEIAGIEPRFETFEGDDDECRDLIYRLNALRYNRTPSQKALGLAISAAMRPGCYWEHRVLPEARAVAKHPRLVQRVMSGVSLAAAHEQLLEEERQHALVVEQSREERRRLEEIRQAHPLLAIQVDEGALTLGEAMTASIAPLLAEHAEAIRRRGKQMVSDAIEIGRRLAESKSLLAHGEWLPWLEREFQWSERTAQNFLRIHELSLKSANIADLELPMTGLYLLAAPSTPEAVRDDVLARAEAGEAFSVAEVRRLITEARPDQPARDHYRDLRNLIASMSRERPDDPLVGRLRLVLPEPD